MMFMGLAYALLAVSAPNATEAQYRVELEMAIQAVTDDSHKQALLRSVVLLESGWRSDVGRCVVNGDAGKARGPYQVHPRSSVEKQQTCSSVFGATKLALARIEESLEVCSAQPDKWKLGVFTSGSCTNRGGRRASELRWVSR